MQEEHSLTNQKEDNDGTVFGGDPRIQCNIVRTQAEIRCLCERLVARKGVIRKERPARHIMHQHQSWYPPSAKAKDIHGFYIQHRSGVSCLDCIVTSVYSRRSIRLRSAHVHPCPLIYTLRFCNKVL